MQSTPVLFENDVKTYSIQTEAPPSRIIYVFENDVKTYSIQTDDGDGTAWRSLRMM